MLFFCGGVNFVDVLGGSSTFLWCDSDGGCG